MEWTTEQRYRRIEDVSKEEYEKLKTYKNEQENKLNN